jgi:hypothetical protein
MQKKQFILLLAMSGVMCAMDRTIQSNTKHTSPILNSDNLFTEKEKSNLPAEVQSAMYTQYQVRRLMKEMGIADKVEYGSSGHYRVVDSRGVITVVAPNIPKPKL